MRGGYQILDIRGLNIQPNDTEVSITDEYVLEQLLKIGDFIDDEAGLIANQLKPINVLLPASSGYANLSLLEAGTLLIDAMVLGGHFVLSVVYGTAQDDYGNWFKFVDSAEYSYTELESGTKLYKHVFQMTDTIAGIGKFTFTMVSTKSDKYIIDNSNVDLQNDFKLFGGFVYTENYNEGRAIKIRNQTDGNYTIDYYDFDQEELVNMTIPYANIEEETVTPL